MTISADDREKQWVGNGTTTTFTGPRAFDDAHVLVYVGANSVYALQSPSTYAVTGVGGSHTTITFDTPPANGDDVLLRRVVEYDQQTDVTNQGKFLPELHENSFDKRVMQIQQIVGDAMLLVFDTDSGQFVWDAKGHRIINLGTGVEYTDAVNLGQVLTVIESVISGTGGVGVTPRYWEFTGDGVTVAFEIPGADVYDELFYDTAIDGAVQEPIDDYIIIKGETPDDTLIVFTTPPAVGAQGFTVLRGYARPITGDPPITSLRIPVKTVVLLDQLIDNAFEFALIRCTGPTFVDLTIRANTGALNDMGTGSFFSVVQKGDGRVEILGEAGVTLDVPTGFKAATRAKHSVISATCENGDSDEWVVTGDLAEV